MYESEASAVFRHRLFYTVSFALSIAAMLATLSSYIWKRKDVVPQKWRRIGTLSRIHLFPIKSCAPLHLSDDTEINCDVLGLRLDGVRDRGLMLINDENNEMITARVYPKLVLIRTQIIAPRQLLITFDQMPPLLLDFCDIGATNDGQDVHTAVWGTQLDAMLCGKQYDEWFSKAILGKKSGLRLVYFPYPKPIRTVNRHVSKEPHFKNEDTGTFHDTTSYMLMNLASIDDLNARLSTPVDPLQFRGNFYVKMDEPIPYAEDNWQWIRIGDDNDDNKIFRVVAPCTRCILSNINVDDGARNPDCQPLKMLKSYRMKSNYSSPALGIHLGLRQNRGGDGGTIKLNEVIYVKDH